MVTKAVREKLLQMTAAGRAVLERERLAEMSARSSGRVISAREARMLQASRLGQRTLDALLAGGARLAGPTERDKVARGVEIAGRMLEDPAYMARMRLEAAGEPPGSWRRDVVVLVDEARAKGYTAERLRADFARFCRQEGGGDDER